MADWHMSQLNGLELLKAIRTEETLRETYVYLVTVEGRQAQIVAAVQAGATGYIMKPFSQESIKQKLEPILPSDTQSTATTKPDQTDGLQGTQGLEQQKTQSPQEIQTAPAS